MAKSAARNTAPPPPPVMLVVLPPDLAKLITDRLIDDDRTLAADLAAIRAEYEPRCVPPVASRRRPTTTTVAA